METKIFKTSEEFVVVCGTSCCDDIYRSRNCGECYFQAGQSFPNDKIKRSLDKLETIDLCISDCAKCTKQWRCSHLAVREAIKLLSEE